MDGKLADILLFLSEKVYRNLTFHIALSRSDLAELTHMSTESVTRIISRFKKMKILKVSGKIYEIVNIEKLKELSLRAHN